MGSKGYLSDIENGLAWPTIKTLNVVATLKAIVDYPLLGLICFSDEDERQA